MESNPWFVVCLTVLLLGVLSLVLVVLLLQLKSSRESLTFLSETTRQQQEAQNQLMSSLLQQNSQQHSVSQERYLSHLNEQTQQVMLTTSEAVTAATSSVSSTAKTLADLLATSQAVIATKDPMAYQTVRGAAFSEPETNATRPYTSTEDLALADAQAEAERQAGIALADQALSSIMNLSGVTSDQPYPAAGAGNTFLGGRA
jgi:hypothetical protein